MKPAALTQNEALQKGLAEVGTHMANFEVKLEPLADPTRELKKQLDPAEVADIQGYPGWLCHHRPSFIYDVAVGPQRQFPRAQPPIEFRITEKGRRKVSLSWKTSPENQFIKILRFDILRKDGDSGEFKVVDQVLGDKTDFTDTTVGARQKYWYRLIQHADTDRDDPVIVHDKTELDQKRMELPAEDIADAVETPQDVYISIDSGDKPHPELGDPEKDDKAKGYIDVKVWRWHPGTNMFVSKGFRHCLTGTKIGAVDERFVAVPKGKPEKVDFTTDAELVSVDEKEVKLPKLPAAVKRIVATVRWPWGQEEELVQGQLPAEIEAQKGKKP
jgi:hypothetical protein